jgi:hypothetical protein
MGNSSRPLTGYDKRTLADDVRRLVRDHLGIEVPISIIYSGSRYRPDDRLCLLPIYRDKVTHLTVIDAPLPGTQIFRQMRTDPGVA